ncbi:MAG: phosphoribosylanthranilate isomerase [Pseudomonadota bacterium]
MSLYIKICGLTESEHVEAAREAGADAIGFVFAESPRRVSVDRAVELAEPIRDKLDVVAVMLHPTVSESEAVLNELRPTFLQTDHQDFAYLSLPNFVQALPVHRQVIAEDSVSPLLFEGGVSGSGELADWREAKELAKKHKLILAGGLNAENVSRAVADVSPWGVDVSSGVEKQRGQKDSEKIFNFVRNARMNLLGNQL